jgi:hypothetical protein
VHEFALVVWRPAKAPARVKKTALIVLGKVILLRRRCDYYFFV